MVDGNIIEKIEPIKGNGNIFRDFHHPDADVGQIKGILAAKIIGILDNREISVHKAEGLTGVKTSEFHNAHLERFTMDRLMAIIDRLHCRVKMRLSSGNCRAAARNAARSSAVR